ncbi:MAG: hypothetical protein AB1500_01005 [Bacillota bacterium]
MEKEVYCVSFKGYQALVRAGSAEIAERYAEQAFGQGSGPYRVRIATLKDFKTSGIILDARGRMSVNLYDERRSCALR